MATVADPAPAKKSRNRRKALEQKNKMGNKRCHTKRSDGDTSMLEKMKIENEKEEILRKKEELETRDFKPNMKENLVSDFKETSNILVAKWKTLSAEDKKPYEVKYQAAKEAYLQVITKEKREREAMKLLEDEQKQKTAMELLDQKVKDPLKPKQPISTYLIYANERRAALREDNKSGREELGEGEREMYNRKVAELMKIAKGSGSATVAM
ncbi:hypothetical protein Bca52824_001584 [Brassica carinata]|uniref:HMG box domain-containing protein n=1 Tax=Brassica carinata TaxID=52824 RepID=A0A8X7WGJ9_BRACI|nr:hypothetical protein Bca52824_001584 [Brassica carinata]